MKKILCFGDSNVFGFVPNENLRYGINQRWSGILKEKLKKLDCDLIEAGCNNRTCFMNNQTIETTGYRILPQYLHEREYDYIIVSLGINDLQKQYNPNEFEIYVGVKKLITMINEKQPKADVILLCPCALTKDVLYGYFKHQFDVVSVSKSKELPIIYEKIANETESYFVNFNNFTSVSTKDGLHHSIEQHKIIADNMFNILKNILIKDKELDID